MTAAGKITAARLSLDDRVMVQIRDTAEGTVTAPSTTKRKGAYVATIVGIRQNPAGTSYEAPGWVEQGGEYVRGIVRRYRRRSDYDLTVKVDRDADERVIRNVTPSQTFWLA